MAKPKRRVTSSDCWAVYRYLDKALEEVDLFKQAETDDFNVCYDRYAPAKKDWETIKSAVMGTDREAAAAAVQQWMDKHLPEKARVNCWNALRQHKHNVVARTITFKITQDNYWQIKRWAEQHDMPSIESAIMELLKREKSREDNCQNTHHPA